jgi:hypothetical protein
MVSKGFQDLFERGFCERCEGTNFVLIPKFLRWNPIINANVGKAREKEFQAVPKKASVYNKLASSMLNYGENLSEGFRNHLETLSKQNQTRPDPDRDPTQTQIGTRPDSDDSPRASSSDADSFQHLWRMYPERAGSNPKLDARRAFNATLKRGNDLDEIEAGLKRYIRFCETTGKIGTETVMQAATFFGPSERWSEPWKLPRQGAALTHSNDDAIARAMGEN